MTHDDRDRDSDIDSVSTAPCSDDDEIDDEAIRTMNCGFLQKAKAGELDEIIAQKRQSLSNMAFIRQYSLYQQQQQNGQSPMATPQLNQQRSGRSWTTNASKPSSSVTSETTPRNSSSRHIPAPPEHRTNSHPNTPEGADGGGNSRNGSQKLIVSTTSHPHSIQSGGEPGSPVTPIDGAASTEKRSRRQRKVAIEAEETESRDESSSLIVVPAPPVVAKTTTTSPRSTELFVAAQNGDATHHDQQQETSGRGAHVLEHTLPPALRDQGSPNDYGSPITSLPGADSRGTSWNNAEDVVRNAIASPNNNNNNSHLADSGAATTTNTTETITTTTTTTTTRTRRGRQGGRNTNNSSSNSSQDATNNDGEAPESSTTTTNHSEPLLVPMAITTLDDVHESAAAETAAPSTSETTTTRDSSNHHTEDTDTSLDTSTNRRRNGRRANNNSRSTTTTRKTSNDSLEGGEESNTSTTSAANKISPEYSDLHHHHHDNTSAGSYGAGENVVPRSMMTTKAPSLISLGGLVVPRNVNDDDGRLTTRNMSSPESRSLVTPMKRSSPSSSPIVERLRSNNVDDTESRVQIAPLPKMDAAAVINVWGKTALGLGGLLNIKRSPHPTDAAAAVDSNVSPNPHDQAATTPSTTPRGTTSTDTSPGSWSKAAFLNNNRMVAPDTAGLLGEEGGANDEEGGDDHQSREAILKKEKALQLRMKALKSIAGPSKVSLSARAPTKSSKNLGGPALSPLAPVSARR